MTSKSWLFEQIPDLSKIAKKMSVAGGLLVIALVLTAVVIAVFHRYEWRSGWRKREFSPIRMGVGIVVAIVALIVFLVAIAVIKSISPT